MLARKALAGTAGAPKEYVEDVFSTYLYKGTGANQTITNNIDISGKGGLVWTKERGTTGTSYHSFFDTERGTGKAVYSNTTGATDTKTDTLTAFTSSGFSLGADAAATTVNLNNANYASWTFRKAKKFFDVVTYTGNGSNRTISHNLGSTPGWIIVKRTDATAGWPVYHRSIGATKALELQITNAAFDSSSYWNNTEPTSTVFTVGTDSYVNANGGTYVAYLFAHDAGGFGDAGSDSIIKCGSFTTNSSGAATVTLDWEPQWLLVKASSTSEDWNIGDNMRGMPNGDTAQTTGLKWLKANSSGAEAGQNTNNWYPTATGFKVTDIGYNNATFIYIAIRRGPMKTPTSGTSVFYVEVSASATNTPVNAGWPADLSIIKAQAGSSGLTFDRLRNTGQLKTDTTDAETTNTNIKWDVQNGLMYPTQAANYADWVFRRAPGFFDVVCYTGTGSATTFSHNLGVAPELMIVMCRSATYQRAAWHKDIANPNAIAFSPATSGSESASSWFNNTSPTSSVFSVGTSSRTNDSGATYVAYLFASVSGVSKVGSYTGNGSSITVTTDFQPRFIMVKRTDSTGDWLVSDSARGLVAGNDPYLELNTTDAEVTNEDWVDISSTSFTVNQTTNNANVNTGTYIYLCIA